MINRIFTPGSEWLYFKLYMGDKSADTILNQEIKQLIHFLKNNYIIDQWFFIRYNDPNFHLRIRVHLINPDFSGIVLRYINLFFTTKVQNHIIWNIQLDTYKRELERYNIFLIEKLEYLFCLNSECIIDLIPFFKKMNVDSRWKVGIYMIDKFLTICKIPIYDKIEIFKELSISFKYEFGFDKYNSKQFNEKYRYYKKDIFKILERDNQDITINKCFNIIDLYLTLGQTTYLSIKNISNQKSINLKSILNSFIHMMINRIIPFNNRLYELIIYDFLFRYYMSLNVRISQNLNQQ